MEDILATFENLIDTTVVNNNTENFLKTVDSLLINMCTGLPLGETALALSDLGILKADMNYLDNVDTNFLSVSCTNCSLLNNSALVKFGSEVIFLLFSREDFIFSMENKPHHTNASYFYNISSTPCTQLYLLVLSCTLWYSAAPLINNVCITCRSNKCTMNGIVQAVRIYVMVYA